MPSILPPERPTQLPEPYYSDEAVTLWHGDSLAVLRDLPDGSVDCCVTSPPYFGLRDYGEAGQYGLEASPAEYVETMRAVFAEVRRVLADDGTLWLNIGDSYVDKRLLGVPWRVALALQDDGWNLRNEIIWSKPTGLPAPVVDRFSTTHEHVFFFSKKLAYWFDLDVVREPHSEKSIYQQEVARRGNHQSGKSLAPGQSVQTKMASGLRELNPHGKNPGTVWTLASQRFSEAHFAVMPPVLAERAIRAGCKPGGVVLDPFSGSGTTGLAAGKHGRRYVGIDLSADYLDLSLRTRLGQTALLDGGVA